MTLSGNWARPQLGCQDLPLRSGEREALVRAAVDRQLIQRPESRVAAAHLPADETLCVCSSQASSHAALLAGRSLRLGRPFHRESKLPRQRIWKLGEVQYISSPARRPQSDSVPIGDTI